MTYIRGMSVFLRHLVSRAVRKAAADPRVREKTAEAARSAAEEARRIVRADDRPKEAGRAMRRALQRLGGGRPG